MNTHEEVSMSSIFVPFEREHVVLGNGGVFCITVKIGYNISPPLLLESPRFLAES